MGGLNILLILSLGCQLATQANLAHIKHHNEVFKNPKNRENLEEIGKFRPSVIGSNKFKGLTDVKPDPNRHRQKAEKYRKTKSEVLVKEFEDFKHIKQKNKENILDWKDTDPVKNRVIRNDSSPQGKIIDQLQKLLTTTEKETTDSPEENVTSPSGELEDVVRSEETTEDIAPSPLSLTSDQEKRGERGQFIHDSPQDDGTFVIVVVGMTLCAIAGVVGVGCFIHKPTCPRAPSPFSDCSPTFQSAKLAFSSSPEEKMTNYQHSKRKNDPSVNKSSDKKSNSRAEKFRKGVTQHQDQDQECFRSSGVTKQESLIDIEPEEEDDDLIYECPGLAPHGEMEVTNPFFLGKDFSLKPEVPGAELTGGSGGQHSLISTNNVIRHGNLLRNIKHGQQ